MSTSFTAAQNVLLYFYFSSPIFFFAGLFCFNRRVIWGVALHRGAAMFLAVMQIVIFASGVDDMIIDYYNPLARLNFFYDVQTLTIITFLGVAFFLILTIRYFAEQRNEVPAVEAEPEPPLKPAVGGVVNQTA